MENQGLSHYFVGVAAKRLSAVETDAARSNQHEFNGVSNLKEILGTTKRKFTAKFMYLGDDEDKNYVETGSVTWYDARGNHPTRSEYRLYYPGNLAVNSAAENDLLLIGKLQDDSLLIIVASTNSTVENHLIWLFDLSSQLGTKRFFVNELESKQHQLDLVSRYILSEIGIDATPVNNDFLDVLLKNFGSDFPSTRAFSAFARTTITDVSPLDDPDHALVSWMEREELLFRTFEAHLLEKQIEAGFQDVDEFIRISLSVQNRRKSRAGQALENHLEELLRVNRISYSRGARTENNSKPDFLFPNGESYHDPIFAANKLTMLGVKSTCKDRWRQVLSEAVRIPNKHLLTLEPGISQSQTDEMRANSLQLVVPKRVFPTYSELQQNWLFDVKEFIGFVRSKAA